MLLGRVIGRVVPCVVIFVELLSPCPIFTSLSESSDPVSPFAPV